MGGGGSGFNGTDIRIFFAASHTIEKPHTGKRINVGNASIYVFSAQMIETNLPIVTIRNFSPNIKMQKNMTLLGEELILDTY